MSSLRNCLRLSALSLFLAAGIAGAADATPINYNINFNVGTAQVIGTIQTDGTLGAIAPSVLNPSEILNWNLTLSDSAHTCSGGPCTVVLQGPFGTFFGGGLQTDSLVGNDLIASPTQLSFNTSSATPGLLRFDGTPGGHVCIGTAGLCTLNILTNDQVVINPAHKLFGFDTQSAASKGALVLGTAVPEPSSLALIASALAMLLFGFARSRKAVPARV